MSYDLEILSETSYQKFLNQLHGNSSFEEIEEFFDEAFNALSENSSFKRALLATQNATLTHNMGKKKPSETVLTKNEFTSRLTAIRSRLQKEKD